MLLVSGLLLEVAEAIESDKKVAFANLEAQQAEKYAAEAKERAANTESNNLTLRSNVVSLELEIFKMKADRKITKAEHDNFVNLINSLRALGVFPKETKVRIGVRHPDRETVLYCNQIATMPTDAGFTISSEQNYSEDITALNEGSDIGFLIDTLNDAPSWGAALENALISAAEINVTTTTNYPSRPYSPNEAHPNANEVIILVVEKSF